MIFEIPRFYRFAKKFNFKNYKEGLTLDIISKGGSLNFLMANDKLIMQGPTELSFNGVINE